MTLKTITPAALLFFLPWLVFFIGGIPAVAPFVEGPLLAGVVCLMATSPLLAALFVRQLQRRAGIPSLRLPIVVGVAAMLANCPVILLVLFVSLHHATP